MPAAVAVKEGLNLPRYPSMPGRLRAKKADIRVISAFVRENGLKTVGLRVPVEKPHETAVLGLGRAAAPAVTDLLEELL
jgi:electron transfer flavoprotein beta subunit